MTNPLRLVPALLLAAAIAASTAFPDASASPTPTEKEAVKLGWVKTADDDGVLCFKREVEGSPIIALRGEGVVDQPITRVASVILDDGRAKEWVDSLEESRLVRMIGDREFIEYDHIGTPFVLKDRDFVTHGRVDVDLKTQTLTMLLNPVEDPAVPEGKYVRGVLEGSWKLQSIENGAKTYVIAEMKGDPKGSVPKWIVNFFQKGWPHNTIQSLRKQAAKPDIRIIPEVKAVFEGKPLSAAAGQAKQ